MIRASPELQEAVNAVRLNADWKSVMGVTPDDAGTFIERVLASVVIEAATEAHNADMNFFGRMAKALRAPILGRHGSHEPG